VRKIFILGYATLIMWFKPNKWNIGAVIIVIIIQFVLIFLRGWCEALLLCPGKVYAPIAWFGMYFGDVVCIQTCSFWTWFLGWAAHAVTYIAVYVAVSWFKK